MAPADRWEELFDGDPRVKNGIPPEMRAYHDKLTGKRYGVYRPDEISQEIVDEIEAYYKWRDKMKREGKLK